MRATMEVSESNVTREDVLSLMSLRSDLENRLSSELAVLSSEGVDMTESLVDEEDYPRSDIDVFKVRHARHNIIGLRNDLRKVMEDIEKGLHNLHRQSRQGVLHPDDLRQDDQLRSAHVQRVPHVFARVDVVAAASPAQLAGLKVGDQLALFGSVNSSNFTLAKVADVVKHSVGQNVDVTVVRDNTEVKKLVLVPKQWEGKGLLGCNIVPTQQRHGFKIDR